MPAFAADVLRSKPLIDHKKLGWRRTFFLPRFSEAGKTAGDLIPLHEISPPSVPFRIAFGMAGACRRFAARPHPAPGGSGPESQSHLKGRWDIMDLGG